MIKIIKNLCADKFYENSGENNVEHKFSFHKIYVNNLKIFVLIETKTSLVFCGIFNNNTNGYIMKLYLLHMFIAFLNFNGDTVDLLNKSRSDNEKSEERILNHIPPNEHVGVKIFEVNKNN